MGKIKILPIKKLLIHERINRCRLAEVKSWFERDGFVKNPIIIDQENFIILDGHHRVRALIELGYNKIPAVLVDYFSQAIRVGSRRKNIKVSKCSIIRRALIGKPYPHKTSKHFIPDRPKLINIKLEKLI